ncbi:MAG: hypothetical protein SPI77_08140 [Corynebacterium sp.]|nr:hypothetical protein [Corynebacterium sp.]
MMTGTIPETATWNAMKKPREQGGGRRIKVLVASTIEADTQKMANGVLGHLGQEEILAAE